MRNKMEISLMKARKIGKTHRQLAIGTHVDIVLAAHIPASKSVFGALGLKSLSSHRCMTWHKMNDWPPWSESAVTSTLGILSQGPCANLCI